MSNDCICGQDVCDSDEDEYSETFEHDGRDWTVSVERVSEGTYKVLVWVTYVCSRYGLTDASVETEETGTCAVVVAEEIADQIRHGDWNDVMLSDE